MYFNAVYATLICSTVIILGWTWIRLRRREEDEINVTQAPSPAPTPPVSPTEEVRAKPEIQTIPSTCTQHVKHQGIDVYIISNLEECEEILSNIDRENLSLLGFDCEWAQSYHLDEIVNSKRGNCLSAFIYPVALVQIATMDSRCYLIRLSEMQNQIPHSLVDILQDEKCLKFGVNCLNDLNRIKNHYLIHPKGAVDLRHLAHNRMLSERMGLQAMGKQFLGIELNKDGLIQRSNWQSQNLTLDQIIYASMDATVSLNIFLSILQIIFKERSIPHTIHCYSPSIPLDKLDLVFDICRPCVDVSFGRQSSKSNQKQNNNSGSTHVVNRRNRNRNRNNLKYPKSFVNTPT